MENRVRVNLVMLTALCAIQACTDLNAPPPSAQLPGARSDNAGGEPEFTIVLPTGSTDVFAEVPLPYHSEDRLYWITASGSFSSYYVYPFHLEGQREFTFGPSGVRSGSQCFAPIKVFSSFSGTQWSAGACGSSDTAFTSAFPIRGNGKARRLADRSNSCADGATHWSGPCRTYDVTTQTVKFVLVESELVVTATPNPAASGEQVTFKTATDPVSANGYSVPYRVTAWRWTPAGGSPTTVCTQTAKNCVRTLNQSGTMQVEGVVNGTVRSTTVFVEVLPDLLQLTVDKTLIWPGESVKFTSRTKLNRAYTVTGWSWQSGLPGPGLTQFSCTAPTKVCDQVLYESGSAIVSADVLGSAQQASVAVAVRACPATGDGDLDDPAVRKGLADMMAASNPNAPGGHQVAMQAAPNERQERAFWIIRRGGTYVVQDQTIQSTQCYSDRGPPTLQVGDSVVASGHTHPSRAGERRYGCRPINGVSPFSQHPNDGLHAPPAPRRDHNGGGSNADWGVTDTTGVREYVYTKDGNLYRLDPGTLPSQRKNNSNRWKVEGGICFAPR